MIVLNGKSKTVSIYFSSDFILHIAMGDIKKNQLVIFIDTVQNKQNTIVHTVIIK